MTLFAKGVKHCVGYIILLSILATVCYSCPEGYYGPACNLLRSCEPLPTPQNAAIIECNTTYLSPCVIRCNEGYKPNGSSERLCIVGSSDNMIWTGVPLLCEVVQCPALPPVKVATVYPAQCLTGPVVFNTVCSYICAAGYGVNNNPTQQASSLVCNAYGRWSEQPPVCNDFSPPRLTCPPSHSLVANDKGKANATVSWSVTVSDNSVDVDPHAVIKVQSSHQSPVDVFPLGSNTVKVTATDEAGNTEDCTFIIYVQDVEPPTCSFCPADIFQEVSDQREVRVNWQRPVCSDNSGVPVAIRSNKQIGESFAVPGSYEIAYTVTDQSNNENKNCSFRIVLTAKSCPQFPPPQNGALACRNPGSPDEVCVAMCRTGTDFEYNPGLVYFCSGGGWQHIQFGPSHPYNTTWPSCSANAGPSHVRQLPYYFYNGDANDFQDDIKTNFLTLLKDLIRYPLDCSPCSKDDISVSVGATSSK